MVLRAVLSVVVGCAVLAGCGADEPFDDSATAQTAEACPNGEQPTYTVFDLGDSVQGAPTEEAAVARFLNQQGSDIEAAEFEQLEGAPNHPEFSLTDSGVEVVRLRLEPREPGWIVISYWHCEGTL